MVSTDVVDLRGTLSHLRLPPAPRASSKQDTTRLDDEGGRTVGSYLSHDGLFLLAVPESTGEVVAFVEGSVFPKF